jgi:hypothetical protein
MTALNLRKAKGNSYLLGWVVATLLFAMPLTLAADPPQAQAQPGGAPTMTGVSAVTDGEGNPVDRENVVGPQKASNTVLLGGQRRPEIQRGQAWWPYGTSLPPYTDVGKRAEVMGEDEILVNGVATLSVTNERAALAQMPADLVLDEGSQLARPEGFYLVKIKGFTRSQKEVDALDAAGAVLGEFININTYIARIASRDAAAVKALPFVTFVGDYQPAYKISPRIGLEQIPVDEAYDPATGAMKPWVFEVVLHKGASLQEVLDGLGLLGIFPKPEQVVSNDEMTVILAATAPEMVPDIARIPGVKWIAEKTYAQLLASSSSPTVQPMLLQNNGAFTTNTLTGWKLWNAGLKGNASGTAQIVTMMDTGLNTKMYHFAQDTSTVGTLGTSHRKVIAYDNYGGDLCVLAYTSSDGGHGTWTTQHAVGSISNMTTSPDTTHTPNTYYDTGIAPNGKVYFQDIGNSAGTLGAPADLGPSITAAIGKGSYIQSHSWGTSTNTYDTTASNLDTAIYNNPGMIVTVAAGNRGTTGGSSIGSPSTAKNVICVGGADPGSVNALFEDCAWDGTAACSSANDNGSSRGPVATSGRIKPDIIGYMANINNVGGEFEAGDRPSAMCQSDATKTVYWDWTNASNSGGTSFATPEIAGLAALIRDYFLAGFYPTGTATPANAITPAGSLVKAMILASGEDMTTAAWPTTSIAISKRYSNDVGYGRVNVPAILHIGSGAPFVWVKNGDSLGDGATSTSYYTINGNSLPLRIMMTWYDAAGNAIQKDADLKVTIGSNVYWGNNFSGGFSTASTSTRDHTNPTEGVFLNAASGLPSSGTVQVDVIGYSDPGGMTYSLVVAGDVASANVTQVSLDKAKYTCSDTVKVTVNDSTATSPVSVTLVSKDSGGTTIDTQAVSCAGSGGVFTGTIQTGSGIAVVDGGSLTATYDAVTPATATISCQVAFADGGYILKGGCDNALAGTDDFTGPMYNGGVNEYYTKYMDAGEYSSYTVGFLNQTGKALTDVWVTLSFSGAGASKMTVLNNPVHVGGVPADTLSGAVFQVYTDPSATGLTSVNMDFDITAPADGYTTAKRMTQVRLLQANDTVTRQKQCSVFDTSPLVAPITWYESAATGRSTNPWRWIGSATTPATVGSENRTDGICSSSSANKGMMVGQSATTTNFTNNADSYLLQNFQPVLRGTAGNGQPYYYTWKWHSFYHASEVVSNTSGVWGAYYNDQWNSSTNPSGDQANAFPIEVCCYYHTILDYVGTWNWETANTGIPDNPAYTPTSGGAPNQLLITFTNVTGQATTGTWFAYGHRHADIYWFAGAHGTNRDAAIDNDDLVYDEYYATAQAAESCGGGGQTGQVAFDRYLYDDCPSSTATLSVVDANATSPLTVTVTSPGTGDSEVVTLTGAAPYFSGTLTLATNTGRGNNNGVLFVLPAETVTVSYTDASPAGTTSATASTGCTGGSVAYVSNTQVADNGDNDGIADNNECITMDITIQNNLATALANTKVTIFTDSPNVAGITDNQALYGTVAAGGTATNPSSDRFTFHLSPTVACADWQNPPTAKFTVVITGDGFYGASTLQLFTLNLDLDTTSTGGSYSYTQNFATDPGWTTAATPDDDGACASTPYVNNFHWCALCGNGGGGYGAWVGNSAWGTSGQNYAFAYDSSTLYSPVFVANGNVTLNFSVAYRTQATYDGAYVQYKAGAGAWTRFNFTTPSQTVLSTTTSYCSPLAASGSGWVGTGVSWTTTNTVTATATSGQTIQFRWRLGGDSTGNGATYGGLGVDNVTLTNLKQTLICEPTRNTTLTAPTGLTNNAAVDLDLCLDSDVLITWVQDPSNWNDGCCSLSPVRTYDVLRNGVAIATGLAYGTTSYTDTTGTNGVSYSYTVRYNNGCGSSAVTAGVNVGDAGDVVCVALDQCHDAGVCVPGTGLCTNPSKTDGATCNDGSACTTDDTCVGGACVGGPALVCDDGNACNGVETCNPASGCVAGTPLVCNDGNPCTDDSCDTQANGCVYTNNTLPCNDGNACTTADSCVTGVCVGGPAPVCDDENLCTNDSCNPATGCVYTDNSAACNDGNVCTDDSCNPATGCVYTNNAAACNDGNLCTQTDVCQNGVCIGTNPVICNDNNSCTDDACNPATGTCAFLPADGNPCTDNDSCSDDHCSAGLCVSTANGTCGVSGSVYYYRTGFTTGTEPSTKVVPNVGIDGSQDGVADATSDGSGAYALSLYGNVVVNPVSKYGTPRASDHNGAITSLDASMIARGAVALITLSPSQQLAGDVSGNGSLSAMDASDVSRFAVGFVDHFAVATATGSDWKFLRCDAYGYPGANGCQPASYSFTPLVGEQTGKSFFAILYGEVTGNWAPATAFSSAANTETSAAEQAAAVSDAALGARLRARGVAEVERRAGSGAAELSVSGWTRPLAAGQTRNVTINLKNADGIRALDLVLTYDPSRIAITGARTTGIADGYSVEEGDAPGSHRIAAYGVLPLSGSGSTLILTIEARKNLGAQLPIVVAGSANEGGIAMRVKQ